MSLEDILASEGRTLASLRPSPALAALMRADGIPYSPELARVLALAPRDDVTPEIIEHVSALLRVREYDDAGNRNVLLHAQVAALIELVQLRGLFGPMRCGSGKTLFTFLAAVVLNAARPVLIVPASLMRSKDTRQPKTQREFAEYRRNWRCRLPRLMSYQELGRLSKADALLRYRPDLILLDEAHAIRERKNSPPSASAKRILSAIDTLEPRPVVACVSGTLITDRLMEYWPALAGSLHVHAPCPVYRDEAEQWGRALDREVPTRERINLGALREIPEGFHAHLRTRRGVVSTPGKDCDATIEVSIWRPPHVPDLANLEELVKASGMRPDGEMLEDMEVPSVRSQIALGFFYVWDPLPPDWWIEPRRSWLAWERAVRALRIDGLDSEGQIKAALQAWRAGVGAYAGVVLPPDPANGFALLEAWENVRPHFEPNTVPVWVSPDVVAAAAAHASAGDPCLIWSRFRAVGEALALHGVPNFGRGTDPSRGTDTRTIAVSIQAHGTGMNLQRWRRSLVLTIPANAHTTEQLIARTHRGGQAADVVQLEYIGSIDYHGEVIARVLTAARAISRAQGEAQKIVEATWL